MIAQKRLNINIYGVHEVVDMALHTNSNMQETIRIIDILGRVQLEQAISLAGWRNHALEFIGREFYGQGSMYFHRFGESRFHEIYQIHKC